MGGNKLMDFQKIAEDNIEQTEYNNKLVNEIKSAISRIKDKDKQISFLEGKAEQLENVIKKVHYMINKDIKEMNDSKKLEEIHFLIYYESGVSFEIPNTY
jgi:hypothetical protein